MVRYRCARSTIGFVQGLAVLKGAGAACGMVAQAAAESGGKMGRLR